MKIRNRKFIQYTLIVITLLIQVIIILFFYNEFFNEKKLREIKSKIIEAQEIKRLTKESKSELINAQFYLNNYLNSPNKKELEHYFSALESITTKIDSTKYFQKFTSLTRQNYNPTIELKNLELLIDSIHKYSTTVTPKKEAVDIKQFQIDKISPEIEIETLHIKDSIPPKKFFSRLKDAFKGNVDTKTDTFYVQTTFNAIVDTSQIKDDFDSTLTILNQHYLNEVKTYQNNIATVSSSNKKIFQIYNNLINISNNLIDVYDISSNDLSAALENQYFKHYSKVSTFRRYTVFGLMILLFIVLIIVAIFIKLSFVYEKELQEANENIQNNLKFKNRIIGMLSHEVRAPLKIINLFVKKIQKETTDKNINDALKSVIFTNNSLLIQATQILEYSKNQNKKDPIHHYSFNLKQEIENILTAFKPYIESVNNELKVDNQLDPNLLVYSDKVKIHQVFINLLGNANKFTQDGIISVSLTTQKDNQKNTLFIASISDTGVGISENDIQEIFQPFYQGIISEKVNNLGAGLGLSLCKEIIDALQGTISINSEKNKGTTIIFKIPLSINTNIAQI